MRLVNADNLDNFAHEEAFGTEDQITEWIAECEFDEDTLINNEDKLKELCWKVLEGCMNVIQTEPTVYYAETNDDDEEDDDWLHK